ncbi:hypothetical protein JTB14_021173 [Gonioctena quinquepunctata]|nr:hypothetical protein JTB14_021173 [Gonioctena quinquepunctata]
MMQNLKEAIMVSNTNIRAFKWKDNKIVHFASNFHSTEEVTVKRTQKDGTGKDKKYPSIVADYNKHMGGVDRADQLRAIYADPELHKPSPVDMLNGTDLFQQLLGTDEIILGRCIVSGPLSVISPKIASCNLSQNLELRQALIIFWVVELFSERVYAETTTRSPDWLHGD